MDRMKLSVTALIDIVMMKPLCSSGESESQYRGSTSTSYGPPSTRTQLMDGPPKKKDKRYMVQKYLYFEIFHCIAMCPTCEQMSMFSEALGRVEYS